MQSFKYMGKYSGRESDLPQREHPDGYVPFREPQDMKKMAIILNIVSLIIIAAFYLLIVLRAQKAIWNIWGILLFVSLFMQIWQHYAEGMEILALSLLMRYVIRSIVYDLRKQKKQLNK